MEKLRPKVLEQIKEGNIVKATGIIEPMPPRDKVRKILEGAPFYVKKKEFKVFLVEELGNYKVYIQTPGEKSDYDFFVWRAIWSKDSLQDLKIPSHNDLGKMFLSLKKQSEILDEYLINATIRFIRDRMLLTDVINRYFTNLDANLIADVKKFLITLKWIALQEDANYPPPNLGSLYTLSVYALLEVFEDLLVLRKVIRF